MDWDANSKTSSVPRPESSFGFFYNYNYNQPHQGMEFKHHLAMAAPQELPHVAVPVAHAERNMLSSYGSFHQEKKKRLSNEQLESLERSFQEEIKLDPDRKMRLSKELGLQPRQIAVWFQNRRARWKTKQLENLYGALKHEYDLISREKMKLQEEVKILKSILREEAAKKQISTGCTDISAEETVESTSIAAQNSGKPRGRSHQPVAETSYLFHVDDYTTAPPPYWAI